jgi:hypothetical protein
MMVWERVSHAVNSAGRHPADKPWRVSRYRAHWYWGYPVGPVEVFDFRWYWQANIVSFLWHHIGGYSCNTWKRNT